MVTEPKPSLVLSLLAALTPFTGAPMLLAVGALASHGQADRLAQSFQEGGSMMYVVLAAGGLLSAVNALLLFLGAYKAGPAALAVLPLPLICAALAVGGMHLEMENVLAAVAMASPADRGIIMCAATAEASQLAVLGFLSAGVLLVTAFFGLSLGALARRREAEPSHRRMLGFAGLGALAAGLWCWVSAGRVDAVADAYRAVAHAAPADRATLLAGAISHGVMLAPLSVALALGAVALFAVGAAVVRASPVAAVALGALGVVTVGGGGGLMALTGTARDKAAVMLKGRPAELLEFPAGELSERRPTFRVEEKLVSGLSAEVTDEALAVRLEGALVDEGAIGGADGDPALPPVRIALGHDVDGPTLRRVLRLVAARGVERVLLVGERDNPPPAGFAVPREYQAAFDAFRTTEVEVALGLGQEGAQCPSGCSWATLNERGITTGGEQWPHRGQELGGLDDVEFPKPVLVKDDASLSPSVLARAAVTARSHGARLVLVFPD